MLPASGPGYEVICLGRNRRFGHPELIGYVKRLGKAAKKGKVGLVVVGDLSQPRGGPTPSGHRSHQTGLDADIGYVAPAGMRAGRLSPRVREKLSPPAVVDVKTRQKTSAWTARIPKLLALAAADPAVDRIFVNPRDQEDDVRGAEGEGALASAAAPVVAPPRSLSRAPEVPDRQPAMQTAGAAPRRRLRALARRGG